MMIRDLDRAEARGLALAAGAGDGIAALAERALRLFRIGNSQAPGLVCVGGLFDAPGGTLSATGNGLTLGAAALSCLAEAVETISQFERPGDAAPCGDASAPPLAATGWIADALALDGSARSRDELDGVLAHDAVTGEASLLPADLCLRRSAGVRRLASVGALSAGVAAGRTPAEARERAILELIERDAAALWWFGGAAPGTLAADSPAGVAAAALLSALRQGASGRITLLLDLTTDLGIPVMAACSHDDGGFDLACGVAARRSAPDAARAALLEMAQMELSIPLARVKRVQEGAVSPADERHLRRARLHVPSDPRFRAASIDAPPAGGTQAGAVWSDLAEGLAARGITVFLVDHTRDDSAAGAATPVIRAVAPALQPFSHAVVTPRLARLVAGAQGAMPVVEPVLPF